MPLLTLSILESRTYKNHHGCPSISLLFLDKPFNTLSVPCQLGQLCKMLSKSLVTLLGGLSLAVAQTSSEKYPPQSEIEAAQASVLPYSPISNVKGHSFNRFVNIWLENTVCPSPCRCKTLY